jgi:cytochrome c peroxidase
MNLCREEKFNLDEMQVLIYSLEGKMCYLSFYSINKRVSLSFMKSESEVLGVPNKYKKLDADLGFELTKPKFIVILLKHLP